MSFLFGIKKQSYGFRAEEMFLKNYKPLYRLFQMKRSSGCTAPALASLNKGVLFYKK